MKITRTITLLLAIVFAAGCASSPEAKDALKEEPSEAEKTAPAEEPEDFAGEVTRQAILDGKARWKRTFQGATPDAEAAKKLAQVEPGAEVVVYLGVWCGDSRREVPRFWKALDQAGEVPFSVRYVGVDRQFSADEVSLEGVNLQAVPTFVVFRGGEEVGRVVETSPNGIETDVLSLLTGEKTGQISASR